MRIVFKGVEKDVLDLYAKQLIKEGKATLPSSKTPKKGRPKKSE